MTRPIGWQNDENGARRYWDGNQWLDSDPAVVVSTRTVTTAGPVATGVEVEKSWFARYWWLGLLVLLAALGLFFGLKGCDRGTPAAPASPTPTPETTEPAATPTEDPAAQGETVITMWVAGGDTPETLREYLIKTFAEENPGYRLVIEEQGWGDLVPQLMTALPDAANTPDVVEVGNTQTPTFSTIGAFREISPALFAELGGDNLLTSFVEVGSVDGRVYAVPYYFGSRYIFYRPDIWAEHNVAVPTTLAEFRDAVTSLRTADMSGFAIGGQDWRNGISWVFAHGGELATVENGVWTSTLTDPNTIAGLKDWQAVYQGASNLPVTDRDVAYWDFINDEADGVPLAASMMAPGWARWSIGDLDENGDRDGMANDAKFGIFALPGVDGGVAPVFAGGSNVAISAQTQHPEQAENLLRIIFSPEYQKMLAENGLGPANSQYVSALGNDKFAQTMTETAQHSKLTPAAPGWAAVEAANVYEDLFQRIAEGGNVEELAQEFDAKLTPMLNGN